MQHDVPPTEQSKVKAELVKPGAPRPCQDYSPQERRSQVAQTLPLLGLFVLLLAGMYILCPKTPSRPKDVAPYRGLVISEVMAANSSAVPDERGEFGDWLELYNGTGADLDMEGVMLTNRSDRITFPFPSYILRAGERVIVFADERYQMDADAPFHGKFKLSSAGDHLYLYDPNMNLIHELATPTLSANSSYALVGVNGDGEARYEVSQYYSPGHDNSPAGFAEYRAANAMIGGALVINEICPDPKAGIPDEDGHIPDWVEIRNTTDAPVPLDGYYLSDKEHKPMKWRFPHGAVVPANGYYLVYCSGKDKLQANGVPHTDFSLSAGQESVVLSDGEGRLVDRATWADIPEDHAYARDETGAWRQMALATPAQPNDAMGEVRTDELIRAYNPTGVIISEVMASNDAAPLGAAQTATDYVELYNTGTAAVDISGYGLSDSLKRPRRWQFPAGTVIETGAYMIVQLDGQPELTSNSEWHANFRLSRAGGETISFCDPTGRVLDRLPLKLIPTDHSYGRTLGYAGCYYYDVPTPGAANGTGYYGYTAAPAFSLPGGAYKGDVQLTIDVPENSVVYYTTDGSVPTQENAIRYTEGETLHIQRVTALRARAFDLDGRLQPSETITQTYLLNLYHAFPVVSVVADPYDLWNEETGMLTPGPNVDKSRGIPFDNAIYRMVKDELDAKPGYVEMYTDDGSQIISQGMELALQGDNSLDFPQKSFKVKAKAKYGAKTFTGKLFEDRPFTEYKGFVLRISGNDSAWTRLIDGFQGRLMDLFNEVSHQPSTVIHQAWRPVVVYLNGIYWGHYNLRERVDRYFVAQHEGLPLEEADNMDILEASASRRMINWGSNKEYLAMIDKVKQSSPGENEADLQYILDNIDVDNYFDYMAFEMFFGNSDPGNIRFYKLKTPGAKWKWIIYDLDYGLFRSGFNSPYSYLKPQGAGDKLVDNTLIRKLMENEQMQDKFLTRLGEVFQLFTTEYMTNVLDNMAAELEPEMPLHFARWAEENDKAISFDNPTSPEGALRYWHTRLDRTRETLKKRPTYFYEMVQNQFELTDEQMMGYFGQKPPMPEDIEADYVPGERWN